jgi:hypothetical protein
MLAYLYQAGSDPAVGEKFTGGQTSDLLSAAGIFVKKKSLKTGR